MKNVDISLQEAFFPEFSIAGNSFYIQLKKYDGGTRYGCFLHCVDSSAIFPGTLYFRFELVAEDQVAISATCKNEFYKGASVYGRLDFNEQEKIRFYILKCKIWAESTFSDFVEKPAGFENMNISGKTSSNGSFKVGDDIVYVIYERVSSRAYFRELLEEYFRDAPQLINVDSEVPILGIDVEVLKMIIEWIYTVDEYQSTEWDILYSPR
jgi:hypothetical protein